jgi:CubicO group peptidase (beta-lactamase class C family)
MFGTKKVRWPLYATRLAMTLSMTVLLPAQAAASHPPVTTAREVSLDSPEELADFLDSFLMDEMATMEVPGLSFIMVKDGEVFLSRGYGFADRERGISFNEHTIVRAGSIAKTVTALGVMQLAEMGLIDLDGDVNQYLTQFQLPETFDDPVTPRELLHYTGGLDSKFIGIRAESEADMFPLGRYLAENLPARTRPPGVTRAYNDHEIALAGLLIEEVTGMEYEQYVQENIFQPLGMRDSYVNVPQELADRVATGYSSAGAYPPNYYYLQDAPGSGFNTTARDLADYMMMHLQEGELNGKRVIGTMWAQELHRTRFRHHPQLPGIAYTFDEVFWGDLRILAKSGGAPGFQNRMLLIPEENIGIYFVYNRDSTVPLRQRLEEALLQALFPLQDAPTALNPAPSSQQGISKYTGYYQDLNDYSARSIEKIRYIMEQTRVTANDDGTLTLFGGRMAPVGKDLFQWLEGGDLAAFGEDESGRVTHLYVARTAFSRIPWHETFPVQMALLGFSLIAFLSGLVTWLTAVRKGDPKKRALPGMISGLALVFIVGLGILFMPLVTSLDPPWAFSFPPSSALLALLALPLGIVPLTAALLVRTLLAWKAGVGSLLLRIHNTTLVLASLAFLFFLHTWNLLGYRL